MNSKLAHTMKSQRVGLLAFIAVLSVSALHLLGGHPEWPPKRHSPDYRQANMLMLRFQDALAAEQWPEALAFCSDRVRAQAAGWPSPAAFFRDTMPVDFVLAQDFGCWYCATNFYGQVIDLTEPETNPKIQWFWAIAFTNSAWVVDYPPAKLDEYVARKKAALQARDERIKQIRQSLEPKVKGIQTRLTAVSERFVIGSPMLFRVELVNSGNTTVHYQNAGIGYHPLTVLNAKREPQPAQDQAGQIALVTAELAAGASVVLADKVDISRNHEITKPGRYFVQFSGGGLQIGEPQPYGQFAEPGRFGENEMWGGNFIAAPTNFPSNLIAIEVTAGRKK
jgi:hypothetical protein